MKSLPVVVAGALALNLACAGAEAAPRLVLQLTVDQLRADLPRRVESHWMPNGFRYLYERGVVYENAHHAHINTETIVGHATLATGAYPSHHGMIGNEWFSRELGRKIYNVEDSSAPLIQPLTGELLVEAGRSPAAIRGTTIADEILLASAGAAKVFGVSVKDRGAIPMAGHGGKAFWYDKATGAFVTSTYYGDSYPDWVSQWNAAGYHRQWSEQSWTLSLPREQYRYADADNQDWEIDIPGFGPVFPHPYGSADEPGYTFKLTMSPAADELTLAFSKALIEAEQIGADDVTDYLSISFSCTDYIGHGFGPGSLEAEDNLVRLDRTLDDLLSYIDERVGLENTLVVLSADHGVADAAELMQSHKIPAGHFSAADWPSPALVQRLTATFGVGAELIRAVVDPFVYLDLDVIARDGLDRGAVAAMLAEDLEATTGIGGAYVVDAVMANRLAASEPLRLTRNNIDPSRVGEVVFFPAQNWFPRSAGDQSATTHGSPWAYDTHVPIIFAGYGLKHATIATRIQTVDIAPTIAGALGIKAPSGNDGIMLNKVVETLAGRNGATTLD